MATMTVLDSTGATQTVEKPLAPGRALAASSRPVALSSEDAAFLDNIESLLGGTLTVAGTVTATPTGTQTVGGTVTVNGIPTTAATRGAGVTDANTLRMSLGTDQLEQGKWISCPASTTTALQTGTAAVGDFLGNIVISPTVTNPGSVQIKDGSTTVSTIFPGGTDSVSNFVPFGIGLGWTSRNTGGWSVVLGSGLSAVCSGNFS